MTIIDTPTADELAFIYSATKKSLRHSREYAQKSNHEAYGEINPLVNAQMRDAELLVARNGNEVRGFIAYVPSDEALKVVFLYVKHRYRRREIAKALLADALNEVPESAELVYVFPTARFADLAARYGFERRE